MATWNKKKETGEIYGQIRGIQAGSTRKERCKKLSEKKPEGPWGPVRDEDRMWFVGVFAGGDGKLCVYMVQEEARVWGGTRASISNGCPNRRLCTCVLCEVVT